MTLLKRPQPANGDQAHLRYLSQIGAQLVAASREFSAVPDVSGHRRHWRKLNTAARATKRWAVLAAVALAGVVALLVVPSLGGSRTAIAEAEVLQRAAAALDESNTILYLQVQDYNADGRGVSMLGGNELDGAIMCVPGPCVQSSAPATAQTGISADPAADTLTYSSQEWLSADRAQTHTIYSNGDETTTNTGSDDYSVYDAADNTLTKLTDMGFTAASNAPPAVPAVRGAPTPAVSDFSDPSYYEQLYQETQAKNQATTSGGVEQTTTQLVGQTTIGSESVYELRIDQHFTPPGEVCGSTACAAPDQETLLYLDSQSYTPVRIVTFIVNTDDVAGSPPGTTVSNATAYSVQRLSDTPANESLLQMTAHSGATQVQATYAQYRSDHGLSPLAGSAPSTNATGATG